MGMLLVSRGLNYVLSRPPYGQPPRRRPLGLVCECVTTSAGRLPYVLASECPLREL